MAFSQKLYQMANGTTATGNYNNTDTISNNLAGLNYTGQPLFTLGSQTTGSNLVSGLGSPKTTLTVNPYVAPQKPLTVDNISQPKGVDQSKVPLYDISNSKSNLLTGSASLDALSKQVTDISKQVQDYINSQKQQPQQQQQQPQQTIWDKLFTNQQNTQNQIAQAEASVPSMDTALSSAMQRLGLTPQSGQQLQDLNTQVNSINQQITDLDNKEQAEIQAVQGTGGIDINNQNAKVAQIQRAYSYQRADLVSKGNFALAQANALQGNIDKAEQYAKDYVSTATAREQQTVIDLQWGAQQYSSLIQAMSTSEQKKVNDQISNAIAIAQQAETERHNQVMEMVNGYKAGVPGTGTSSFNVTIPQGTLASQNNNPGNIKFANQPGATMGAGGFAKFATPQDGFNAISDLLKNYMSNNPNITLAQAITTWAPPSENDTKTYIQQVSDSLGVPANTKLSDLDMASLAQAIAQKESGTSISATENDYQTIAKAIENGSQPPDLSRLYGKSAQVRAQLAKDGFDLTKATQDWTAMQKRIATMNSTQQVRLQQAVQFSYDSLDVIQGLANQWDAGQFPILNKANLKLAMNGAYGQDAASLATRLNAQINDLTSELGTVYKGGNTSTDESLKLAAGNLNANWSKQTLLDAIGLAKTNLQIRKNSIAASTSIEGNQYSSSDSSGGTDYTSILDSILANQ